MPPSTRLSNADPSLSPQGRDTGKKSDKPGALSRNPVQLTPQDSVGSDTSTVNSDNPPPSTPPPKSNQAKAPSPSDTSPSSHSSVSTHTQSPQSLSTPGSSLPSSPTVSRNRQAILDARAELIDSTLYLAEPSTRDACDWTRVGTADLLTVHGDGDAIEPAIITFIGVISSRNFYLWADGGVTEARGFTRSLADATATCIVEKSLVSPVSADFVAALSTLEHFESQIITHGFTRKPMRVAVAGSPVCGVRLRHRLFQERTTESSTSHDPPLPSEFQISQWPVRSAWAQAQLQAMKDTHDVNILPAYDVHGDLIPPASYADKLSGATCAIQFRVSHWPISKKTEDTFVGDIEKIEVLVEPVVIAAGKRKLALTSSPSKRAKV